MSLVVAGLILTALRFKVTPSPVTEVLFASMTVIAVLRVFLVIEFRHWQARRAGNVAARQLREIVRWETIYAIIGVAMMLVIGMSTAYATVEQTDPASLVTSVMITIGIAGCIPGRNGSRPTIVALQIAASCIPFVVALIMVGSPSTLIIAVLTVVFFAAAMSSTKAQYMSLKTAITNEARARLLARSVRQTALQLDTALNAMSNGLLMFDERARLVIANDRVKTMWGRDLVESLVRCQAHDVGVGIFEVLRSPDEERAAVRAAFRRMFARDRDTMLVLSDNAGGRVYNLHLSSAHSGGIVVIVDDVTEKRRKDQEIHRLAHRDTLTGLANRFDLSQQMVAMIERGAVGVETVAMFIDLDGFKAVNDYFGHAAGDEILKRASDRIIAQTRRSDLVARIGGDEFVVCFQDAQDLDAVSAMAQRLIDEIARPYIVDGKTIEIGASAGLSLIASGATTPDEVLRLADVALYEAKTSGRGRAVWFRTEMDDRARTHREMTLELRKAIDADELSLHYQPVVDFRTGRIVCCEALARWTSKTRGVVSPSVFIPLAEATDLIHKLGDWALGRALSDAALWPDGDIKVAVNLSAAEFKRAGLAAHVRDIVARSNLPASRLELEITESTLAEDLDSMKIEMDALQADGISIALDDFGKGYSSLSYLHSLPIQKVKLDTSFVRKLDRDPSAITLIASIVQMTQAMQKTLVIEGVETAEELALIAQAQARLVQGYHFAKPMPQDEMIAFIERTRTALPATGSHARPGSKAQRRLRTAS